MTGIKNKDFDKITMKFITGKPAMAIGKKLVIADLHLGFEKHIKGLNIRSQTGKLADETAKLLEENSCKELIILGDLKHSITVQPDVKEALAFTEKLKEKADITLVQGNHDGALQNYLDVKVVGGKGFRKGKYYFMHGHAEPGKNAENSFIITSHIHPAVEFKDSLGGKAVEKAWLKGKNAVIMPAFNPLIGGLDVRKNSLGVISKYADKKELAIYLLDGLYIGKVKELPVIK